MKYFLFLSALIASLNCQGQNNVGTITGGITTLADSQPHYKDREIGAVRIASIRRRLTESSCPWTSDGNVTGWWSGEQPGVEIRHWNAAADGLSDVGHPVANFHQGPYGMGGNAVADARFAAHACADIQFLLDMVKGESK
jgi:hypothetical protein